MKKIEYNWNTNIQNDLGTSKVAVCMPENLIQIRLHSRQVATGHTKLKSIST